MQSTKTNIRQTINDYLRQTPDGLDVTAFVMERIGHDDFRKFDVKPTGKTFEQAKQDMGKLIKELLDEMFRGVEHLSNVAVDPAKWPALSAWVTTYTQHRVAPNTKRL